MFLRIPLVTDDGSLISAFVIITARTPCRSFPQNMLQQKQQQLFPLINENLSVIGSTAGSEPPTAAQNNPRAAKQWACKHVSNDCNYNVWENQSDGLFLTAQVSRYNCRRSSSTFCVEYFLSWSVKTARTRVCSTGLLLHPIVPPPPPPSFSVTAKTLLLGQA